jgi:hypothetical protein
MVVQEQRIRTSINMVVCVNYYINVYLKIFDILH